MLDKQKNNSKTIKQIATATLATGINFLDGVIIIKSSNSLLAFEAKCTHLGCQLKHAENGIIRCSCHGSAFNQTGIAVQGPAFKPLKKLPIKLITDTQMLEIQIP